MIRFPWEKPAGLLQDLLWLTHSYVCKVCFSARNRVDSSCFWEQSLCLDASSQCTELSPAPGQCVCGCLGNSGWNRTGLVSLFLPSQAFDGDAEFTPTLPGCAATSQHQSRSRVLGERNSGVHPAPNPHQPGSLLGSANGQMLSCAFA